MLKTLITAIGLTALTLSAPLHAQSNYPQQTIRIVSAFAPGGIADNFARVVGGKLAETWGQPVVVENRTGAGGNIGSDYVAKSAPDGYTLLVSNIGTHAVNVHLFDNLPFDPIRDFVPIAHLLEAEGLLVVHPDVKANSVPELIALARAQPGKLTYASGGQGTTSHLAGELFKSLAKVNIVHVPYKGNAPAIAGLVGGHTQLAFATMPTVLPMVQANRLRALAVIGAERTPALDVPTINESLPGMVVSNWIGLFAPAGTSPEIVARLNAEVQKIMQSPDVQARLAAEGARFIPSTPASFAAFQKEELENWGKAIREAGIKLD